jgi:hypothetical protein
VTCLKVVGLCIPLCLLEMLKIPSAQLVNLPYILLFATYFDFLLPGHFQVDVDLYIHYPIRLHGVVLN